MKKRNQNTKGAFGGKSQRARSITGKRSQPTHWKMVKGVIKKNGQ